MTQAYYNVNKTFSENFSISLPDIAVPPFPNLPCKLFGKPLISPLGIAACPMTVGSKIQGLASMGFGLITYKTVRSHACSGHALPNVAILNENMAWTEDNYPSTCLVSEVFPPSLKHLSIANSIGIATLSFEEMLADIQFAKQALGNEQMLNVSIYGEGNNASEQIQDFVWIAKNVVFAGADCIEVNLSCPNISGHGLLFEQPSHAAAIIAAIRQEVSVPIIAKLGFIRDEQTLIQLVLALIQAGASGICGINTVATRIIQADGTAFFGDKRQTAGVSGIAIHKFATSFVKRINEIRKKFELDFAILGVGGVMLANHFNDFLLAGADIALCATASMWNPFIAVEYLQEKKND